MAAEPLLLPLLLLALPSCTEPDPELWSDEEDDELDAELDAELDVEVVPSVEDAEADVEVLDA